MFNYFNKILVLSYVLVSSTLLQSCSKESEPKPAATVYHQAANIETIQPQTSYQASRQYIGKVVSKQFTSLSFEYSGNVAKVWVDNGDSVTKGQLLAELNTELLLINLQEIDARILQLNAQAKLNRLNLKRINESSAKGYSSQQTLDELETEKTVIAADLSRQKANKAALKYQLGKAKLYAPFNATISNRAVAEGELFSPNQTAFELIKQSHHEVSVGVPIKIANKLIKGTEFSAIIESSSYSVKLLAIGKQVNPISRTVELRFALNEAAIFYHGQLATVTIKQYVEENGFWLPLSALTDGIRGQWNVYKAKPIQGNLYDISAATIDIKYATDKAAYVSGLELEPQHIVMTGVHRFVAGQQVRKLNKNESAKKGNTP